MYLLGLDLETSGKDPNVDRILEVGAVLWDWEQQIPVRLYSEIINPSLDSPTAPVFEVSDEIEGITGLSTSIVEAHGNFESDGLSTVTLLAREAGYVVAHFGNQFDKLFIEASLRRHSYTPWEKHWLDTSIDVVYPARIKTRNLRHLASEHGFVNPFSHRAVFDVLTMFQIMRHYDLEEIISRSKEPVVYLQALIPFDQKEYAKGRGYRWCAEKKIWWKSFKQSDAEREKQEAGFLSQYIDKPE